MARVFVSHAAEDRELAGEVHRWLVEADHEVFPGQGLQADTVVCVVTSAYPDSTWCAVEVGIARALGSRLLPLRAEPGVAHPLLTSLRHFDYAADPATARTAHHRQRHRGVDIVHAALLSAWRPLAQAGTTSVSALRPAA